MDKIIAAVSRMLEWAIALALLVMVVLVFGNVVLRYALNSGITFSEEISRWLFVWLTFLGALVALGEHGHLGTDALVGRLGPTGKKVCLVLGHLLMLYITWLLFRGSWEQVKINWDVEAPVSGYSVGIFYAAGLVFAVLAAPILLRNLWLVATGRLSDADLVMIKESEEAGELEALQAELARENDRVSPSTVR